MMVEQISVFLENKPNRLFRVTEALREADINLRAAMIAETGDFGIVRAIVDDPDAAIRALHERSFTAKKTNVVGVQVEDGPGGLCDIAQVLGAEEINIQYLYAFSLAGMKKALLILKTSDNERSRRVITDRLGLTIVNQADINAL